MNVSTASLDNSPQVCCFAHRPETLFHITLSSWPHPSKSPIHSHRGSTTADSAPSNLRRHYREQKFQLLAMDEDISNSLRRMSSRTRKVAPKMAAALASSDNRTQAALARLEALENDNPGTEMIEINDDDDASLDDDDQAYIKRQSKSTKRKTRQAKALENAKKAPRTFLEILHESNLDSLPPHVPSYLRAAVGSPSSTSRRHFCTVCGFTAKYTCIRCGMRFCAIRCQNIHNDTRCLKFVA